MEAPEGHIADALEIEVYTSASTVGLPLLSKICRALTLIILLTSFLKDCQYHLIVLINFLIYLMESYLDHQMVRYQDLGVFL